MANLTYVDKLQLEKLLGMGSGYVLNFSDKTFQEFVVDSVGIDMYAPGMDAGGTSKAKRLRYFWKMQPNQVASKLLLALCDYYQVTKYAFVGTYPRITSEWTIIRTNSTRPVT